MTDYTKRDLWLEARNKTRTYQRIDQILRTIAQPFRKRGIGNELISTEHGLICDLNKYRPNRDLKTLLERGVNSFIFRMGGPTQWIDGAWKYEEDATWRPYMDQAKKLGIVEMCGGYIVHNPFEDWRLQGIISNVHINLVNQWTSGGYMPGYLCVDHEINYCYRGATKVLITGYNLVESLNSVTDQIWKTFHKVPLIYTARWFIDQNDPERHMAFLDTINSVTKQRPMWYAWYPTILSKLYANADAILTEIATPTSTQIARFAQCGSYSQADAIQFTDRLKLAGTMLGGSEDPTGVDASYTMGSFTQFCSAVNVKPVVVIPPVEPPVDNTELEERVADLEVNTLALTTELNELKALLKQWTD